MERDPAQRLINWFGVLMLVVCSLSAFLVGWASWRVWLLVSALLGG